LDALSYGLSHSLSEDSLKNLVSHLVEEVIDVDMGPELSMAGGAVIWVRVVVLFSAFYGSSCLPLKLWLRQGRGMNRVIMAGLV